MKIRLSLLLCFTLILGISCEKEPGPGGKASIQGKIRIFQYNSNCSVLQDEYYGIDEEVYLVYGDDPSYSERERTGPDGTYWFPYLRPGKYKVYAISNVCDTLSPIPITDSVSTVLYELEIKDKKKDYTIPDLNVVRN